jgi:alpha,alpha-trehalose phosphorylase
MLHHERLRPPSRDYPADEWNVVEKAFHPEFLAQLETMLFSRGRIAASTAATFG